MVDIMRLLLVKINHYIEDMMLSSYVSLRFNTMSVDSIVP